MSIAGNLLDLIYPPVCHSCGKRLARGERWLCARCLAELPRTYYERRDSNPMTERFAGRFPLLRAASLCHYSNGSPIASILHDFKYRGCESLAEFMGEVMGRELAGSGFFDGADYLVPVPMHFFKRAKRGYNQVEALCRGLSAATGIPVRQVVKAATRHRSQTVLTGEQRRRNMEGVFRYNDEYQHKGRNLVLVDDVCTTGSTLLNMALTIIKAEPGATLSVLTLASTDN